MHNNVARLACLGTLLLPLAGGAQTPPPDAGSLLGRTTPPAPQHDDALKPGQQIVLPASAVAARVALPDSTLAEGSLEVKAFRFAGDLAHISEPQLQALVAGDQGKVVTLKQLHRVADKVERYLQTQQQLLVAKAWVPLQDVQDGVVEIRVLQGTVEQLKTDAKRQDSPGNQGALAAARAVLAPGAAIERNQLEQALFRVSDYVGGTVRAVLVPAEALGRYDVMFELDGLPKLSGSIAVDNTGNRATSAWHETLNLKVNDVSGHADQFSLQTQLLTPNQRSLRLHYQLPLDYALQLGATAQFSRYHLCCAFSALEAEGDTRLTALDLSRAWLRSRAWNVYGSAELLQRKLTNRQHDATTSDHTVNQLMLGVKSDWSADGALNYGFVNLSGGDVSLDEAGSDVTSDLATARTGGRYTKLNVGFTRTQPAGKRGNLVFNLNGQLASKNLDSSETFLLGGMGAIRAYPSGESAGDDTLVAQLEYHYNATDSVRLFGFFDAGWIRVHHDPWPTFTGDNEFSLKGVGLGAVWKPHPQAELSLIGARKIGANPQANPATGNDSDGLSGRYRVWAFANLRF